MNAKRLAGMSPRPGVKKGATGYAGGAPQVGKRMLVVCERVYHKGLFVSLMKGTAAETLWVSGPSPGTGALNEKEVAP